jgi:hypothetical protein
MPSLFFTKKFIIKISFLKNCVQYQFLPGDEIKRSDEIMDSTILSSKEVSKNVSNLQEAKNGPIFLPAYWKNASS